MASTTTTTETRVDTPHSIEVNVNAKGDYSWAIKVYTDEDLSHAIAQIHMADRRLRKLFRSTAESIPEINVPRKKDFPKEEEGEEEKAAKPERRAKKDSPKEDEGEEEKTTKLERRAKKISSKVEEDEKFNIDDYEWDAEERERREKKEEEGEEEENEEEEGEEEETPKPKSHPAPRKKKHK